MNRGPDKGDAPTGYPGRPPSLAVLGAGTVGGETVRLLLERGGFELKGVLARDLSRPRAFSGWRELVTADRGLATAADVVVELMGGVGEAAELSLAALRGGAVLVTANKAMLAERWPEFLPFLAAGKVHFEAAVMAGTPVVGPLSGALRGCAPVELHAVLNGTCNVILAQMERGTPYLDALAEAQRLGYAEADPTLDVGGWDAAHKLTLLARLAFDPDLSWEEVRPNVSGIADISADDLARAHAAGRRVRLIGSLVRMAAPPGSPAEGAATAAVSASSRASVSPGAPAGRVWRALVRPLALPDGHPLVTAGATNALLFRGDPLGEVVLRGPGAGAGATATAVVSDVLAALAGRPGPVPLAVPAKMGGLGTFAADSHDASGRATGLGGGAPAGTAEAYLELARLR